jgi:hypothetical protein
MKLSTKAAAVLLALVVGLALSAVLGGDAEPRAERPRLAAPLKSEARADDLLERATRPDATDGDRVGALLELAEAEPPVPGGRLAQLSEDPTLGTEERELVQGLLGQ